jgi:hypothetical protein
MSVTSSLNSKESIIVWYLPDTYPSSGGIDEIRPNNVVEKRVSAGSEQGTVTFVG